MMFAMGTRSEAIRLAPLIREAEDRKPVFESTVVLTTLDREGLDDVFTTFDIQPDLKLNLMSHPQRLSPVFSGFLRPMEEVIKNRNPEVLLIEGGSQTCVAAGENAFYAGLKVAHVGAGLRSGDRDTPFPDELERRFAAILSDYHFVATETARQNLIAEGCDENTIYLTGHPGIDALARARKHLPPSHRIRSYQSILRDFSRMVLVTCNRSENLGRPMAQIWKAFKISAIQNPDTAYVYPVHPNPELWHQVEKTLGGISNFFLMPLLPYPEFCWLMQQAHIIVTDSGGVQEEAVALGKPVLVTNLKTNRPETEARGRAKLVGHDVNPLLTHIHLLLHDKQTYRQMSGECGLYGEESASGKILDVLENDLCD